jgi:hypothetical protein
VLWYTRSIHLCLRMFLWAKLCPFVLHDTWQFWNFCCNLSGRSILVRRHSTFLLTPLRYKYVAESFFVRRHGRRLASVTRGTTQTFSSVADNRTVVCGYLVFVLILLLLFLFLLLLSLLSFLSLLSTVTVEWLAVLLRIRDVPASNLGPDPM